MEFFPLTHIEIPFCKSFPQGFKSLYEEFKFFILERYVWKEKSVLFQEVSVALLSEKATTLLTLQLQVYLKQLNMADALKVGACAAAASLSEVSASDGVKTAAEVLKLAELYGK